MTIKLDHINLTVENLKDSIEWYRKVFGFELVESGATPEGVRWGIIASNCFAATHLRNQRGASSVDEKPV